MANPNYKLVQPADPAANTMQVSDGAQVAVRNQE